jgi:hypothetical protein
MKILRVGCPGRAGTVDGYLRLELKIARINLHRGFLGIESADLFQEIKIGSEVNLDRSFETDPFHVSEILLRQKEIPFKVKALRGPAFPR